MLLLTACSGCSPDQNSSQENTTQQNRTGGATDDGVFDRGDAVQALLQERVRAKLGDNGNDFQVYVTQIAYPIGTIMPAGRTIAISVDACKPAFETGTYELPNMFPSIAMKGKAAFDLGLDNAVSNLAKFGVKADREDVFNLSVNAAAGQFLVEDQLRKVLAQPGCAASVRGRPIVLVRGYVVGKRSFLLQRDRNASGEISVTNIGGLKVEGSKGTAVSLEDEKPAQFLQIVSIVSMPGSWSTASFKEPTVPSGANGRVYIQRDQQDTSVNAAELVTALKGQDFNVVPQVEAIASAKMPRTAQVRYFHPEDAEFAGRAAAVMKRIYPDAATLYVGLSAPARQLEVWLPRVAQ